MVARKVMGAMAAVSMIASPVLAAPVQPAPPIPLETVVGDHHYDGARTYVIPLLALVAILFGVWAAIDDDEDLPASP